MTSGRAIRRIDPAELGDPASVRPPGGAVFDLHVHSSNRSMDSGVSADAILQQAVERGLDGICFTEHNSLWPREAVAELAERHGITVLAGMELGTDVGHVLAFGLPRYSPELLMIDRLRPIARVEGAILALAHPMRVFHGRNAAWDEMAEWFDALEAINGDHGDTEGGPWVRLAAQLGLSVIGGSDVHSRDAVGRVVTAVHEAPRDIEGLVREIRLGRVAPHDLRPQGHRPAGRRPPVPAQIDEPDA